MRSVSYPPWWRAIIGRKPDDLKKLMDDGLDPSVLVPALKPKSPNLYTSPLAYIVGACNVEMLKIAIPYCSSINGACSVSRVDNRTHTPLQRAQACGFHGELSYVLLHNGAVLTDDLIARAKRYRDAEILPIHSNDLVVCDFYDHVQRMKAAAWCMGQVGDVWPDMVWPVVHDRMGNDDFSTALKPNKEQENSDDSSFSWSDEEDDSSSSNVNNEEDAGPRKKQKLDK